MASRTETIENAVRRMGEGWFTCSDVAEAAMEDEEFASGLARTHTRLSATVVVSVRLRGMVRRGELESRPRGYTHWYEYRRTGE